MSTLSEVLVGNLTEQDRDGLGGAPGRTAGRVGVVGGRRPALATLGSAEPFWPSGSPREPATRHSIGRGLSPVPQVEFGEDVLRMVLHSVLADHEAVGDLGVREALDQELQHVHLAPVSDRGGA